MTTRENETASSGLRWYLLAGVLVLGAIGGALWLAPRASQAPAADQVQTSSRGTPATSAPTPSPAAPPSPTPAPAPHSIAPLAVLATDSGSRITIGSVDTTDPEELVRLIEHFGSVGALYRAADPDQRYDILDYLHHEDLMRAHLAEILPFEDDSQRRTYLLRRVDPIGLMELPEGADEDFVDRELMALLDQPTATPMEADEYQARLGLAVLIDSEYALDWVRDARAAYPADPNVSALANSYTLTLSSGGNAVPRWEVERAGAQLMSAVGNDAEGSLSESQRLRAYHALLYHPDRGAVADFYKQRIEHESSNEVQEQLTRLQQILSQMGPAAAP